MGNWIIGVIDIVLIVLILLVAFVGFKNGFMKKVFGLAGVLLVVILSIMFAGQLANWLTSVKMPPSEAVYKWLYNKVPAGIELGEDGNIGVIRDGLGIPYFFAGIVYFMLGKPDFSGTAVAETVALKGQHAIMSVMSFFIILIGVYLVIGILKLIASAARKSVLIRVIDGLLGIVLHIVIFGVIVLAIFTVFRFVFEKNPGIEVNNAFFKWIYEDMHLGDNEFRISKSIYNNNVIYNLIHIFF